MQDECKHVDRCLHVYVYACMHVIIYVVQIDRKLASIIKIYLKLSRSQSIRVHGEKHKLYETACICIYGSMNDRAVIYII